MLIGLERWKYNRKNGWYFRAVYICGRCGEICVSFRTFNDIGLGDSNAILRYCEEWMQCCLCFGTDWRCRYCYKRQITGG